MQNSKIILKQLKSKDYEIGIEAAKVFYNDKISKERMRKFLADSHNYLIVATINNSVVGFVLGYCLDSWHKDSKEILLYDIETLSEYRRNGIGTMLIDKLKSIIKKEGYKELWLPTNKSNKPAVEFYKRMGGIQKNEDDVLFAFDLK